MRRLPSSSKRKASARLISNQRGSMLITIIAVLGGILAATSYLVATVSNLQKVNSRLGIFVTARLIQEEVAQTIQNDEAWAQTVAHGANSSFACLRSDNQTCPIAGGTFRLLKADGNPLVGFDINGELCSSNCMFTYTFTWKPSCPPGGSCLSLFPPGARFAYRPFPVVNAVLTVDPDQMRQLGETFTGGINLNPVNYSIVDLERGRYDQTLASACQSIGGKYDQVTERCTLMPALWGLCSVGEIMVGIDANGNRICEPSMGLGTECSNSSAVVGIGPSGEWICGKF